MGTLFWTKLYFNCCFEILFEIVFIKIKFLSAYHYQLKSQILYKRKPSRIVLTELPPFNYKTCFKARGRDISHFKEIWDFIVRVL